MIHRFVSSTTTNINFKNIKKKIEEAQIKTKKHKTKLELGLVLLKNKDEIKSKRNIEIKNRFETLFCLEFF